MWQWRHTFRFEGFLMLAVHSKSTAKVLLVVLTGNIEVPWMRRCSQGFFCICVGVYGWGSGIFSSNLQAHFLKTSASWICWIPWSRSFWPWPHAKSSGELWKTYCHFNPNPRDSGFVHLGWARHCIGNYKRKKKKQLSSWISLAVRTIEHGLANCKRVRE